MRGLSLIIIGLSGALAASAPRSNLAETAELPVELARWMPERPARAWQGAWEIWLPRGNSSLLLPAAVEIRDDAATIDDGLARTSWRLAIETPCSLSFQKPDGPHYTDAVTFVVNDGAPIAGQRAVGMRRGRSAIVCTLDRTITLDDHGTCVAWNRVVRHWVRERARCAWQKHDGDEQLHVSFTPVLTPVELDLIADSHGLLHSTERGEDPRKVRSFPDFASAQAASASDRKPIDPSERAKAAGGVVGDTTTINGVLVGSAQVGSGRHVVFNYVVADSNVPGQPTLLCIAARETSGLVWGQAVAVHGKVIDLFEKIALEDCTITPRTR